jgi:uncharacterized protein YbaP (TraB family)
MLRSIMLAWLLASWVHAQPAAPTAALLWHASREGGPSLRLTASLPAGVNESLIPQTIWNAIDNCAVLVTENEVVKLAELQLAVQARIILPANERPTAEHLANPSFQQLATLIELPVSQLATLHPAALRSHLELRWLTTAERYNSDELLAKRALAANKQVIALDTIEQTCELHFAADCREPWYAELANWLVEPDLTRRQLIALRDAFDASDAMALAQAVDVLKRLRPAKLTTQLAGDRYTGWIQRIESLTTHGELLIALDPRHLLGADGLLERLRSQGYTVVLAETAR